MNIFLSSFVWARPRPVSGCRHHVLDLYSKLLQRTWNVYPTKPIQGNIVPALTHLPKFKSGTLNVVTQGYPIIAAFLALLLGRRLQLIVHTWKVPGHTDDRLTARLYDFALDFVIRRADLVVVASEQQRRQVAAKYPTISVVFAPVTVDSQYWSPYAGNQDDAELLLKFGLEKHRYVLTVGGKDRDERLGIELALELGIRYVRVTYAKSVIEEVRAISAELGASDSITILFAVTDNELRALYRSSYTVCLPTITKTNPAGLSALVESLAVGAVVIILEDLAQGYVTNRINGLCVPIGIRASELASDLRQIDHMTMKSAATAFAISNLNGGRVAESLRSAMRSVGHLRGLLSESTAKAPE